ncbi:uncharacterized protein Z519_07208 [Cladophialophora bantiana CBS 173.52]|uniref:Ubiquitin-conjugating enzyme E2C-binding protein n=1 Tax=Cladophialophora bantiana (strain ATCC 10958 / CBS 173.52 / CDC B-1940 / NIH 8579) TaxID=1442370 RepID=A0A0D2I5Q2_CLAB1|nr:uncharacterized protein Z519_07208 [Cladophialophora bantiana CBS 173.52]KIW92224.1 hypothetical protein Z519_07208 [Cladophialophora bantiana CBS 173.52]
MPKPKIVLYAEALTHIGQLTLHASLQTEKNEHTKILLSSDKKVITAIHDGESSSIYLPTQISGSAHVTFPFEKRTEISTRLQIDDVGHLKPTSEALSDVEVPWSAVSLHEHSSINCSQCDACILVTDKLVTWKDLPGENWADLMDFWFCHKPNSKISPHDHAAESGDLPAKGKVTPSPGVGLVDTVSFLLSEEDCANIEVTKDPLKEGVGVLRCLSCKSCLGLSAEDQKSYRLYKSRLAIIPEPGQAAERFPAAVFLTAQLLASIASSVNRKVVVHDDDNQSDADHGLLLWIFNPDIYYSSSKRGPTAHRAMKVFYKSIPHPEEFLDRTGSNCEELVVPKEDFFQFKQTLEESTDILPQSARTFQDWNVGLLDRWEKNATGSAKMDQNPLNKKVDEGFEIFKLPAGMKELYL